MLNEYSIRSPICSTGITMTDLCRIYITSIVVPLLRVSWSVDIK